MSQEIKKFNELYGLPYSEVPTLRLNKDTPSEETLGESLERIKNFTSTMLKEIDEGMDIEQELQKAVKTRQSGEHISEDNVVGMLTAIADWLVDITVYARSEAAKFGIPYDAVFQIVMDSNMSKLGADGKPIINAQGKVEKGPNYWKPEPKIFELIKTLRSSGKL